MKKPIIILFLTWGFTTLYSQGTSDTARFHVLRSEIIDGDTLLLSDIPEVRVYPQPVFENRWQYWRYRRLVKNVKAAYPYARKAGEILYGLESELAAISGERKRKQYVNEVEEKIREEFEDEVKHLTITQGRILIKLIDRETGNTTYEVLQDIKGNFSAVFWQAIARVFGSTLKSDYEPEGDDYLIEQIILMIEAGQL